MASPDERRVDHARERMAAPTFSAVLRNIGNRPIPAEISAGSTGSTAFLAEGVVWDRTGCQILPMAPGARHACVAGLDDVPPRKWCATPGSHQIRVVIDDIRMIRKAVTTTRWPA